MKEIRISVSDIPRPDTASAAREVTGDYPQNEWALIVSLICVLTPVSGLCAVSYYRRFSSLHSGGSVPLVDSSEKRANRSPDGDGGCRGGRVCVCARRLSVGRLRAKSMFDVINANWPASGLTTRDVFE